MAFLYREAELLDDRRFRDWLAVMSPDVDYRVPVRTSRDNADHAVGFSDKSFHMLDTLRSLEARIARLETPFAWSEIPPSRTRRLVSNIRVQQPSEDDTLQMRSNFILYRARGDTPPELLCGERRDTLRREGGQWKLWRRLVLLDQTYLPTQNLGVFL